MFLQMSNKSDLSTIVARSQNMLRTVFNKVNPAARSSEENLMLITFYFFTIIQKLKCFSWARYCFFKSLEKQPVMYF